MPFISSLRGTFGAQSKRNKFPPYITGVSGSVQGGSSFNLSTQSITWSSAGEYSFTLPLPTSFRASVFGAGGGGGQQGGWSYGYPGGSGGYSTAILDLPAGTYKIIVGEGGGSNSFRTVIGGGHSAQPKSGVSDNRYSACAGGFSGIFTGTGTIHDSTGGSGNNTYRTSAVQSRSILIAGGGGGGGSRSGGNDNCAGGHGGGSTGTGGFSVGSVDNLSRGTQTATGEVRPNEWGQVYNATLMHGGSGGDQGYGGAGGGGYFAGSNSWSGGGGVMGGGGGGSGFIHPSLASNGITTAGSAQTSPGGVGQTGYITGSGYGGNSSGNTTNSWQGGTGGSGIVHLSPL